jgi:hypothetical protein
VRKIDFRSTAWGLFHERLQQPRPRERRDDGASRDRRPPFDTSELDTIPCTTDDDPPYRNWWVVDKF